MWIRLDDQDSESEPIRRAFVAGPSPLGLHHRALLYAGAQLTDGRADELLIREWIPHARVRARCLGPLLELGLWRETAEGFEIVGFLAHNPSRAEVLGARAAAAARRGLARNPAVGAAVRLRDGDRCRFCGAQVSPPGRGGGSKTPVKLRGNLRESVIELLANNGPISAENLAISCIDCASKKAGRSLKDAGMTLLSPPGRPSDYQNVLVTRTRTERDASGDVRLTRKLPDPTRPRRG